MANSNVIDIHKRIVADSRSQCVEYYRDKWPWAQPDIIKMRFNGYPIELLEDLWGKDKVIIQDREEILKEVWDFHNLPVDQNGKPIQSSNTE